MARTLINVPASAKRGDIIEIKTLISHPMESGYRVGPNGVLIPRDIIQLFTCTYNGAEVFRAELSPAIAANPFIVVLHGGDARAARSSSAGPATTASTQTESAPIVVE